MYICSRPHKQKAFKPQLPCSRAEIIQLAAKQNKLFIKSNLQRGALRSGGAGVGDGGDQPHRRVRLRRAEQ